MHADGGRSEGIFGWEDEGPPVLAVVVRGVWGAGDKVVPFEDVGFGRVRVYVGRWVGLEGCVFPGQAFVGGFGGHGEGCERISWRVSGRLDGRRVEEQQE